MSEILENKFRVFTVGLKALEACSSDICSKCASFQDALSMLKDELVHLKTSLGKAVLSEDVKKDLLHKANDLTLTIETIEKRFPESEAWCQKSVGKCKLSDCLSKDSVSAILKIG
ncbi:MAG: hypothetical protein ACUVTD_00200 [Nitrososphaerales archaeon]